MNNARGRKGLFKKRRPKKRENKDFFDFLIMFEKAEVEILTDFFDFIKIPAFSLAVFARHAYACTATWAKNDDSASF